MQILPTLLLLFSLSAWAAQDAVIAVDQAPVRERPSFDAVAIESLPVEARVKVSSQNKDGWYKVKASTGQYGWLWQGDLTFRSYFKATGNNDLSSKQQGEHEDRGIRPYRRFSVKAGGLVMGIAPTSLNRKLGLGDYHPYFLPGGFIEAGYRVSREWKLGLRFMGYSVTNSVKYFGVRYDITHEGYPLLVGAEVEALHGERIDVNLGLYGGLSLTNRLTVEAPAFPAPNSFSIESSSPAVLMNVTTKYFFSQFVSGVFEAGLYYSYIPKQEVPGPFNADGPFRDDLSKMTELSISHLGIMAALGLQFDF